MKWALVGLIIVLLLPFYAYILSKSVHLGKFMAIKSLFLKENKDGKKEEK